MKLFNIHHQISITGIIPCLVLSLCSAAPAKPLQVFSRQSKEEVFSLAFSADGQRLAIGSSAPATLPGINADNPRLPEGTMELWDVKTGKLCTTLRQSAWTENSDQMNRIGSISFSPDGKWVVGSDMIGYTLWDLATGRQKYKWHYGVDSDSEKSVGWSGDSRVLILPSVENERFGSTNGIAVIDVATGERTAFFPVEIGHASAARISPDGKLLATAGFDGTVRVFDLAARTNLFNDFAQCALHTVSFSPDGRYLIGGSGFGGALLIYEITSAGGTVKINKLGHSLATRLELHQIDFTPDGKQAFANCYGVVALWDATSWAMPRQLPNCQGRLSPDGAQVALVREGDQSRIELWNLDELAKTMSPMMVPEAMQVPAQTNELAKRSMNINACKSNLQRIKAGKQMWALDNHKTGADTPTMKDLQPYFGATPNGDLVCPDGGAYTIGQLGENPTCSIPSHVLP